MFASSRDDPSSISYDFRGVAPLLIATDSCSKAVMGESYLAYALIRKFASLREALSSRNCAS